MAMAMQAQAVVKALLLTRAEHGAADHVGRGDVALGDAVVQHQPPVEPLPLRRVEGKRLAFADPSGQAIYRVAFAEHLFHYGARFPHGGYRRGRQRDRLTMSRHRHNLRNSQVTSIEADRH